MYMNEVGGAPRRAPSVSRGETGAAAVEFALVMPVLIMILFGTINFGIALSQKASMANAVRTAARYGSVNLYNTTSDPHTCTKAIDRAKEGTPTLGMSAADVTFEVRRGATETAARSGAALCTSSSASTTPPCQGSAQGDNLYVFAKYSTRLGIPMTPINTALDLVSVGVYRCEYS